jgi:hypothetical protein
MAACEVDRLSIKSKIRNAFGLGKYSVVWKVEAT